MTDYELSEDEVRKLWIHFVKIDKRELNSITLNQIFMYLDERTFSIVAPFLERFFELIDKK